MTGADVMLAGVFAGLVVALFVLALAEASMLRVRHSEVAVAAESGDRRAQRVVGLLDRLPEVMNAILFSVLLAQVTATTIAGVLASRWLGGTGATVSTVAVTLVVFVYGEAIPKTLAVRRPLVVALRVATPVRWVDLAARPAVWLLVRIADVQSPGSGVTATAALSEEELRHLVDEAAEAGRIEVGDAELIERSFVFGDTTAGEVLVPLAGVVAVAVEAAVGDALETAIAAGHRRLVVLEGSAGAIVGFVRLRDLVEAANNDEGALVGGCMRDLLWVGVSDRITSVLRSMQATDCHLAVVMNEDETVAGIVTVEDIVEELVGSIDEQA
jgi:CBS domain containing-hemolysin-like protein